MFKTRIELRQIGVRDETKILGGIGICGRPLCCHTYLADFVPVSIKMAKEQNISLNPSKISGNCGRLMCCLKYENDAYTEAQKDMPRIGSKIKYDNQVYKLTSINLITKIVRLENHNGVVNIHYDEIKDNILPRETPVSGSRGDN